MFILKTKKYIMLIIILMKYFFRVASVWFIFIQEILCRNFEVKRDEGKRQLR